MKRILFFTSQFCNPCIPLKRKMDKLGVEYKEIDVEQGPEWARVYHIRSVPTILILNDSTVLEQLNGNVSITKLREALCEDKTTGYRGGQG